MAAYAALVSLMHSIHQIKNHPSPPISLNNQQVQSLTENVTFLQEFLDSYNSPVAYNDEVDPLEIRIAYAAYAAEDVIESRIVDTIYTKSTVLWKLMSLGRLFRGLCECAGFEDEDLLQVIEEMNLIKKEVMKIIADKPAVEARVHVPREVSSTDHVGSSSIVEKKSMMVGFDQVLLEVLDKVTGGQLRRQIIPITGMGGIGKTTLARNLFENALIKEYFDIRIWTTISQIFNLRETLRDVLFQASGEASALGENNLGKELYKEKLRDVLGSGELSALSEDKLGENLYKHLSGRRYLIVMDDIWRLEVWDKINFYFPDYNNGSRIIITTRMSDLTSQMNESYDVGMKFLDLDSSWSLFCKIVFEKGSVPIELENIGKKIVANCRGLPLSIATIGGLLAKSKRTREHWRIIEKNLNSIVITDNDEYCLKILKLSYIHLPNYLKPCFLYMGVFEEDWNIRVSTLTKLWVSEGFLKPVDDKCLEATAEEYIKDLVDRNLILVHQSGFDEDIKFCKIHDLLRDLCLREAVNERFYHVLRKLSPSRCICSNRRIVIPQIISSGQMDIDGVLKSSTYARARSLICDTHKVNIFDNLRLLRTLKLFDSDNNKRGAYVLGDVFQLVNLRYLAVATQKDFKLHSSINQLWNLQTLIIYSLRYVTAPIEFWNMSQLRHVEFTGRVLYLPQPPHDHNHVTVMENLQTLRGVRNFYLDENVVNRIPNTKKLDVSYVGKLVNKSVDCLSYLQYLSKLETFRCYTEDGCDEYLQQISFPRSLKKLKLNTWNSAVLELEELLRKASLLPLLQKLAVNGGFFRTRNWETVEGQFQRLRLLDLSNCGDFVRWTVLESAHFPLLQEIRLHGLRELKEIPIEIGEIATLKAMVLDSCSRSVVLSAKRIIEEQEDVQGDIVDLHVTLKCATTNEAYVMQYLAGPNFHVLL